LRDCHVFVVEFDPLAVFEGFGDAGFTELEGCWEALLVLGEIKLQVFIQVAFGELYSFRVVLERLAGGERV